MIYLYSQSNILLYNSIKQLNLFMFIMKSNTNQVLWVAVKNYYNVLNVLLGIIIYYQKVHINYSNHS